MLRPVIAVTLLLLASVADGLRVDLQARVSRRAAFSAAAVAAVSLPPRIASADSKYDKKFEACLSQCVYETTKITKGVGQVEVISRSEAYATCKPKCATSKEQLLLVCAREPNPTSCFFFEPTHPVSSLTSM